MPPLEPAKAAPSAFPKPKIPSLVRWLTLALLLAVSLAVRLVCLSSKPFWFDECFSVEVSRIGWSNFLHLMWWREANMSLYYVLLRIWLHLGQSPFFIRSLSVIPGAATLPAVYWLARSLYDRRVALIATALITFNSYDVRYSQEARSYTLFVLLATLSSGFLTAWLRRHTRRNWLGYVLTSGLAMYAHFYALLLVAAQWVAIAVGGALEVAGDPELRALEVRKAYITFVVAVSPLIVFVLKTGAGPIRWIQRPGFRDVFRLFEHLAGGTHWLLLAMLAAACVAAVVPIGKDLLAPARNWETWRAQFLMIWLLLPIVLTVFLSFLRPVFLARYMIFCLPAFLILASAGLARLRRGWVLGGVLFVILLLCSQGITYVYGHDLNNERDASVAASNFILDHSQADDGVIFHIAETRIPYEFSRSLRAGVNTASSNFSGQLGPEILFPRHGPALQYQDFTGKPTADFVRAASGTHSRVWLMLMNNGAPDQPDPTTGMLSQTLAESFPKVQRWQFTKVEVRLYSKE